MLKLIEIQKSYKTGEFFQAALDKLSLEFRRNEFAAVLGPSGSGKTTLLNIIGGLDRYDSGDMILNGKSTRKFRGSDWDAYRNNSVGFVFQSYNLISHISVLQNVELGMMLSGVSAAERRRRAMDALERVGIREHAKKRPNQLSGGQMQRVAIARALANNPDIILADEPTGALDSTTSLQIMDLIREIAADKLVIMVTHNAEIAHKYATRILELKDGRLVRDSNPILGQEEQGRKYELKKTAMNLFSALHLSFNNIMTKKGRTLLTAFASSIGIIGIALILALSNGFDQQIGSFESDTMSAFPIAISETAVQMDVETMRAMRENRMQQAKEAAPSASELYPYDPQEETVVHENRLSGDFVRYLEEIDPNLLAGIRYSRATAMNLLIEREGEYVPLNASEIRFSPVPTEPEQGYTILEKYYDLVAGSFPQSQNEVLLVLDGKNRMDKKILSQLGLDPEQAVIPFESVLGLEWRWVPNDLYYKAQKTESGEIFLPNPDYAAIAGNEETIVLRIAGILRSKPDTAMPVLREGIAYSAAFMDTVLADAAESKIVLSQKDADYNVMTGEPIDRATEEGREQIKSLLMVLGGDSTPYSINVYPVDFESKDEVTDYLDAYNAGKEAEEQIFYTDYAKAFTSLSGNIMDAITIVLVAFSSISLVVSVIMIGIITYISVLERTKEIGVLRALGARKKDITRVFNAETFIVGVSSGLLGVFIARMLVFPVNRIIESMSDVPNVAEMDPIHAALLVVISVSLTILGGFIPAKMASKKDPVAALRTE